MRCRSCAAVMGSDGVARRQPTRPLRIADIMMGWTSAKDVPRTIRRCKASVASHAVCVPRGTGVTRKASLHLLETQLATAVHAQERGVRGLPVSNSLGERVGYICPHFYLGGATSAVSSAICGRRSVSVGTETSALSIRRVSPKKTATAARTSWPGSRVSTGVSVSASTTSAY